MSCSLKYSEDPTRLEDQLPVASSRLFIPYSVHLKIMLSLFYYFKSPNPLFTIICSALMLLKEVGEEKGFSAFPLIFYALISPNTKPSSQSFVLIWLYIIYYLYLFKFRLQC